MFVFTNEDTATMMAKRGRVRERSCLISDNSYIYTLASHLRIPPPISNVNLPAKWEVVLSWYKSSGIIKAIHNIFL